MLLPVAGVFLNEVQGSMSFLKSLRSWGLQGGHMTECFQVMTSRWMILALMVWSLTEAWMLQG